LLVTMIICFVNSAETTWETKQLILKRFMDNSKPREVFKVYHLLFEKSYEIESEEGKLRYKQFRVNLRFIKKSNLGNHPYQLGLTTMSDLSKEEIAMKYLIKKNPDDIKKLAELFKDANTQRVEDDDDDDDEEVNKFIKKVKVPTAYTAIDWRGALGPARNQGSCGSCWAFATAAAVEGNMAVKGRNPNRDYLSPQQLMDCDTYDNGCNGGMYLTSMKYAKEKGIQWDRDYTYKQNQQTCLYNAAKVATYVPSINYCSNYMGVATLRCSIDKVYNLVKSGPVGVGIDGGTAEFGNYVGGIFTARCDNDNHAVLLVGYGVLNGVQYWLVRNSWGAGWGSNGHIKVGINEANNFSCFVDNEAVLPIVS